MAPPVGVIAVVAVVPPSVANAASIDQYDSGMSHHMSTHRQEFVSFTETKMTLNAANQQPFYAHLSWPHRRRWLRYDLR